jgi:hypothetical protein
MRADPHGIFPLQPTELHPSPLAALHLTFGMTPWVC